MVSPARAGLLAACAMLVVAAAPVSGGAVVPDRVMAKMAARLFPLLAGWPRDIRPAPVAAVLKLRRERIAACVGEPRCVLEAARWTDPERDTIAKAGDEAGLATTSDDRTRASIVREIAGINAVIGVYGQAVAPRYPKIDGPDPDHAVANAAAAVALAEAGRDAPITALDPSIGLALALLDGNDRDDAAAFEPLEARFNHAAMVRARTLDWSRYRYTAIIVPGIGPEDLATPLSALGKLNVQMAVTLWKAGLAPFVLFSGGTVHPRGTRAAEAVEMARAASERFGVPASAILIEPYARHTTTNLRNATRRLVALGAPLDRPALISTNPDQSRYIASETFTGRNAAELGYQPGRVGARLAPTQLLFLPSRASLRIDPLDPLDP
jgi:hypothetical protein